MISKIFDAVFTAKYPRGYTGRHRAPFAPASVMKPTDNRSTAVVPSEAAA